MGTYNCWWRQLWNHVSENKFLISVVLTYVCIKSGTLIFTCLLANCICWFLRAILFPFRITDHKKAPRNFLYDFDDSCIKKIKHSSLNWIARVQIYNFWRLGGLFHIFCRKHEIYSPTGRTLNLQFYYGQ